MQRKAAERGQLIIYRQVAASKGGYKGVDVKMGPGLSERGNKKLFVLSHGCKMLTFVEIIEKEEQQKFKNINRKHGTIISNNVKQV